MRYWIGFMLMVALCLGCNTQNKEKEQEESTPQITTVEFSVDGMHCMGCVETVQASARQLPGVEEASASLEDANARVVFDASQTDTTKIKEAIELNGYQVTAIRPTDK